MEIVRPVLWESAVSGDAAALFCILEEGDDVYAGAVSYKTQQVALLEIHFSLDIYIFFRVHRAKIQYI